jgi:hypothetical protein
MHTTREGVYECTYASAGKHRTAHVRAWDAREAGELFADELRADGIAEPGSISVRARSDSKARRMLYRGRFQ